MQLNWGSVRVPDCLSFWPLPVFVKTNWHKETKQIKKANLLCTSGRHSVWTAIGAECKEQEGEGHNVDRWSWRLQAILSVVEGINPRSEEQVQFACMPDKDEA